MSLPFPAARRALAALAVVAVAPAALAAQTFDFDDPTLVGQSTPLFLSAGGLNALFSSPVADAYTVAAVPGLFESFTGGYLLNEVAPAGTALRINFGQTLSAFTFRFGTTDLFDPISTVELRAFLGATEVGVFTASGAFTANGLYAVGTLAATGAFDRVAIRSLGDGALAVDDITVRTAQVVPEPATVALLGAGLAAVGAAACRRRVATT